MVVIPVAALWLVNALWLGRRQELLAARQGAEPEPPPDERAKARPVEGVAKG